MEKAEKGKKKPYHLVAGVNKGKKTITLL